MIVTQRLPHQPTGLPCAGKAQLKEMRSLLNFYLPKVNECGRGR
jgi:hypothetical protein